MNQEKQGKTTSKVVIEAAAKEVIPAEPAELSDKNLDKVVGGRKAGETQKEFDPIPIPPPVVVK